ncbi:hypothetical protein H4Q26_000840 [Puccinia striiformis f. sp. tritici PST-130]|nr:hypothetical protein H4Q26_000840 [Puccinia striiformis f. sp. tritici PST-130]
MSSTTHTTKKKTGGRNNTGRITVRHLGGGHKQRLRTIDFHRNLAGPQEVVRIEYDPGRSAHIALIKHSFKKGIPRDLISSSNSILDEPTPTPTSTKTEPGSNTKPETDVISAKEVSTSTLTLGLLRTLTIKPGNYLPIRLIPAGTTIHAISLKPDGKASLVRSAGTFAKVVSLGHHHRKTKAPKHKEKHTSTVQQQQQQGQDTDQPDLHDLQDHQGDYAQIKLQSGEIRFVHMDACAAIGSVSNPHWQGRKLGKAGRVRWLGRRPRVRGVAMNKVDHPLGGGRGKSKSNKQPVSPAGLKSKGLRTRRPGLEVIKWSSNNVLKENMSANKNTRITQT